MAEHFAEWHSAVFWMPVSNSNRRTLVIHLKGDNPGDVMRRQAIITSRFYTQIRLGNRFLSCEMQLYRSHYVVSLDWSARVPFNMSSLLNKWQRG